MPVQYDILIKEVKTKKQSESECQSVKVILTIALPGVDADFQRSL